MTGIPDEAVQDAVVSHDVGPNVSRETGSFRVWAADATHGGGRFIGRGRLALAALYWVGWLAFSRRTVAGTSIAREVDGLGVGALRLVTSSAILIGLIAVFQVAYQLSSWGAESMSIRTIAWFVARELGPLTVALLVVARSAAAIAAELASMRAGAEIDALQAMGLDPVKYLVAPKLAALLLVLPALTLLADSLITFGCWIGSRVFLGYSTSFFLEQYRAAFEQRDLVIGLGKSIIFALIIALVAADEGLSVESRFGSIGEAATRSIVFSVIGVLAADTVVNAVFYFIPGLV
ncbi:MAG: MlaE family ABC transporter permease [Gemmatimonadaceae bacterium]